MGALKLGPLRCGDPLNITTIREGIKRISRSRTSLGAALITNDPLPIRWRSGEGLITPRGCEIRTPMTIYIYIYTFLRSWCTTRRLKLRLFEWIFLCKLNRNRICRLQRLQIFELFVKIYLKFIISSNNATRISPYNLKREKSIQLIELSINRMNKEKERKEAKIRSWKLTCSRTCSLRTSNRRPEIQLVGYSRT